MVAHILWLLLYSPAMRLSQRELTIAPPVAPLVIEISWGKGLSCHGWGDAPLVVCSYGNFQ